MNYATRFWSIFLGVILLMATLGQAQDQTLIQLKAQFETYGNQTLQEKLFVHTDRSFYLTGEVMWFRFFYVDGMLHGPLDVSKVAYLELLDKDQKSVLQTKVSLEAGKGIGSLLLPASLSSGTYVLRAYTYWMKSVSPEFLFEKPITIVNPFRKLGLSASVDSLAYDVQFFPEGGNLVKGLPAKVGFKVVDRKTGRGVDCKGAVLSQAVDTLTRFTSLKFGMGTFSFTPLQESGYRVLVKDLHGRTISQPLPTIYPQGYAMQLEEVASDQLKVTVRTSGLSADASTATTYLIGHTRQVIKVAQEQRPEANQTTFLIPKSSLGEGVSHLTVFNAAGQPVCERLYFKRPLPTLNIELKPDNNQYVTRAPVSLSLLTNDQAGASIAADLSVSVYRLDSLQTGEGSSLPAYLWLTSDLRGTIESPDYYLTNSGPVVDVAVDNLMLTQGWRRFHWEAILQNKPTLAEPEHRNPIIRGRVTNARTGVPTKDVIVYLSVPGKANRLQSIRSNEQGLVQFEMPDFYGARDVVLQVASGDSAYKIDVINPFSETSAVLKVPIFDLTETLKNQLMTRSLAMQIQNSYYNQYTYQPLLSRTDSSSFYGTPDELYLLDTYTRFTVMEEVLSEYVPGVNVRRHNKHFALRVNNIPYREMFDQDPLILLDGVPVFGTDRLMAFSALKIKSLEVVTKRYFLGYSMLPGIISFRTYKNDFAGFQLDPHSLVIDYDGLQAQREFYAPQYTTPAQTESRLPDFRNLLYWNPQVLTSAQGKANLTFYTSDQEGTYLIVAQGMTTDGRFSQRQQLIRVRPIVK